MSAAADLPERERNRVLRRADWRFLLADPAPAAVGWLGADAGLREAVAALASRVVELPAGDGTAAEGASPACDLVVLADPDAAALRTARAHLAPGGALYAEWGRRRAPRPGRARQLLAAAGFERVRCYRAWPSRDRALAWVPSEAPGALRYLLGVEPRPGAGVRHLVASAARRALRAAVLRPGLPHPLCALAVRAASDGRAAADTTRRVSVWASGAHEPPALRALRAASDTGSADQTGPLSWLLLTPGGRSINKVIGLAFPEPAARPQTVVKTARVPESRPALAREAAVLWRLTGGAGGAAMPRTMPRTVPRVVLAFDAGAPLAAGVRAAGLDAVAETAMAGRLLLAVLRPWRHADLAERATQWLVDFAEATRRPADDAWARVARTAFDRFADQFGPVADAGMLRDTGDRLSALGALPVVCEHRDFSPWNVLVDGRGLAVLDWESAELDGVPGPDLIYFLAYLGFYRDRARGAVASARSYRAALRPDAHNGRVRRACLASYAARVGFDGALWHPLALLTWVLHAASEYRQFRADAGGADPSPAQLRTSVFFALWDAELRGARP